ncbi:hypothetical protein [Kibdelosporangium philippinense]
MNVEPGYDGYRPEISRVIRIGDDSARIYSDDGPFVHRPWSHL